MRDLKADLELCEKATKGPWEIGVTYLMGLVNDGSDPNWVPPKKMPKGECTFCHGKDTFVKEFKDEDGRNFHVHRFPEPKDWRRIWNAEGEKIVGNYDWEDGGICISKEDAKFIAAAREGWPEAIHRAMELEEKLVQIAKKSGLCPAEIGLENSFDCEVVTCTHCWEQALNTGC